MVLFGMSNVTAQDVGDSGNETVLTSTESITLDQTNDVFSTSESIDDVVESNDSSLVNAETQEVVGVSQEELGITTDNVKFVGISNENKILGVIYNFNNKTNSSIAFEKLLNSSNSGDTIQIEQGTYNWNKPITLNKNINIIGTGKVILNANNTNRHFFINTGINIVIKNIEFTNGYYNGNGGSIYSQGILTLFNCNFTNNSNGMYVAGSHDGIIYVRTGTLNVDNCNFRNNVYCSNGGSIRSDFNSILNITNCNFINNSASNGAGIGIFGGTAYITNCYFSENIEYGNGFGTGAITCYSNDNLIIDNCTFENNKVNGTGYENIQLSSSGSKTIINSRFDGILYNSVNISFSKSINLGDAQTITYKVNTSSDMIVGSNNITANKTIPVWTTVTFENSTYSVTPIKSNNSWVATFTGLPSGIYTIVFQNTNIKNYYNMGDNGTFIVGKEFYISPTGTGTGSYSNPTNWNHVFSFIPINGSIYFTNEKYLWNNQVTLKNNISLIGMGNVVLDANNSNRHFYIPSNLNITIKNIEFINGYNNGNGGSIASRGILTVINCNFTNNSNGMYVLGSHDGIIHSQSGYLSVHDCIFRNNVYCSNGGGIRTNGGVNNITGCKFINNTASNGAGIGVGGSGTTYVTNCYFIENKELGSGVGTGAVIVYENSNIIINNCTFENNKVNGTGYRNIYRNSGIITINSATLDVKNASINNLSNIASGSKTISGIFDDGTNLNTLKVVINGSTSKTSSLISHNSNMYSITFSDLTSGIYTVSLSYDYGTLPTYASEKFGVGNLYISPSGSSNAIGTSSKPTDFDTALTYIYSGGTIYFTTGTYTLSSKTINQNVNLLGSSSTISSYKIKGTNPFTVSGSTAKFQNLTFTSCTSSSTTKAAITITGGTVTINNCAFSSNSNSANGNYKNIYKSAGTVTVTGCSFDGIAPTSATNTVLSSSSTIVGNYVDGTNLNLAYSSFVLTGPASVTIKCNSFNGNSYSVGVGTYTTSGIYSISGVSGDNTVTFTTYKKFGAGDLYIGSTGSNTNYGTTSSLTDYDTSMTYIYNGGTIYFYTSGVYSLSGKTINQDVALRGMTSNGNYNITGTKPLTINSGNVKLQYLTFTSSVNALTVNSGTVELDNCLFIDNTATTDYRNIYAVDTTKITLNDCVFDVNESTLNKADIFANQTEHINGTVNHGTNLGNLIPYTSIFKLLLDDTELPPVTFDGTNYSYNIHNLNVKDAYKIVLQGIASLRVLQSTLHSVFKY